MYGFGVLAFFKQHVDSGRIRVLPGKVKIIVFAGKAYSQHLFIFSVRPESLGRFFGFYPAYRVCLKAAKILTFGFNQLFIFFMIDASGHDLIRSAVFILKW